MELLVSITVPTSQEYIITIIPDIERNGYAFTDGCGRISAELLKGVQASFCKHLDGRLSTYPREG